MDWSELRPRPLRQQSLCENALIVDDDILYNTRIRNLQNVRLTHYRSLISQLQSLRQAIIGCAPNSGTPSQITQNHGSIGFVNRNCVLNGGRLHGGHHDDGHRNAGIRNGNGNVIHEGDLACDERPIAVCAALERDDELLGLVGSTGADSSSLTLIQHYASGPNLTEQQTSKGTAYIGKEACLQYRTPHFVLRIPRTSLPPLLLSSFFQHEYATFFARNGTLIDLTAASSAEVSLVKSNKRYNAFFMRPGNTHVRIDSPAGGGGESSERDMCLRNDDTPLFCKWDISQMMMPKGIKPYRRIYYATNCPDERRSPAAPWMSDISPCTILETDKDHSHYGEDQTAQGGLGRQQVTRENHYKWAYTVPLLTSTGFPTYVSSASDVSRNRLSVGLQRFQSRTNYPFRKTITLSRCGNCLHSSTASDYMRTLISTTRIDRRLDLDALSSPALSSAVELATRARGRFFGAGTSLTLCNACNTINTITDTKDVASEVSRALDL